MTSAYLIRLLAANNAGPSLLDLLDDMVDVLPLGVEFDADVWNCISWALRPKGLKTQSLNFAEIEHPMLRIVAKVWVLDGRLKKVIGYSAADQRLEAIRGISAVIGARDFLTLKTVDLNNAQGWFEENFAPGTAFRACCTLEQTSRWLSLTFGLRLDYKNSLANPAVHGRYGAEKGRLEKLIPLQVLADLLKARNRPDLIAKDKFYLSLVAANVGAGLRVNEMTTLPFDCLLKEGRRLQIRLFAEKGGKSIARPIDPMIADVVEDALSYVREVTEAGRRIALAYSNARKLDWSLIYKDTEALQYFVGVWAHEWTVASDHQIFNPSGAWYEKEKRFVDVVSALKSASGRKGAAAQSLGIDRVTFASLLREQEASIRGELNIPKRKNGGYRQRRTTWDTDSRVISIAKFMKHSGIMAKRNVSDAVRDIIEVAKHCQLQGKQYPCPQRNAELERHYLREYVPVVRRPDGTPLLYPHEALLVIQKYQFANVRVTKCDDFTLLIDRHIASWLAGEVRSQGTGNLEDSAFRRLGILDERTNDVASFTWHDIRHWLNTVYQNGGFTQDQIALLFNRKSVRQNATYDQTSKKLRAERVAQGIRDRMMVGIVPDTYHRLAEFSREEAEEYLDGAVRQVNPMPHGHCTLNWAQEPCPHHMSCFKHTSEEERACEHLVIDPEDEKQVDEVRRINRESGLQIKVLSEQLQHLGVEDSPQLKHLIAVQNGTQNELAKVEVALRERTLKNQEQD